jgi:hypothetical protein
MSKAILVYGNIASFKWNEENYQRFFNTFGKDVDVFLSHDLNSESSKYIEEFRQRYNAVAIINDPITERDIYKKYMDEFLKTHYGKYYANTPNMTKHYTNKKRVLKLLKDHMEKTGKVYDYVCMTRLDLLFNKNIEWNTLEKISNTLYIPEGNDFTGLNDRICIGDFDSIEKYANIYDNSVKVLDNGCEPFPEAILAAHVKDIGINIKRFPLDTFIIRLKAVDNNSRSLVLNTGEFEKCTRYYSSNKVCSIMIDDYKDIFFKKIVAQNRYFSWFGYNLDAGKMLLTFDIKSSIDIDFPFIKTHNPDLFHVVKDIKANTLTSISIDLNLEKNSLLIFIFDTIPQIINISFYNITFTKI